MKRRITLAAALALALAGPVHAADVYKIGAAVGLTGYAATTDRGWRDGLQLAADYLNGKGGIDGHKVELVVEDNKSDPQQAVVAYQKMMSNDHVQIFASGCVSAGNFAAAGAVARAKIPMVLCSILPRRENEIHWAFSFLPPPIYELQTRMAYLKDNTQIRKVGILNDPSPYAMLMAKLAETAAKQYGIQVVAHETYQQDDSDMSVQVGRINAAGAGAIIKIGIGGSTVTIAKNVKQLGLKDMLLLSGLDDAAPYVQAGEVLGDHFMFAATAVQIPSAVTDAEAKAALDAFLTRWKAKYGDRDGSAASRAWDAMMVIDKAVTLAKSTDGPKVRDALEEITHYQGAAALYEFSPKQHNGVVKNPFVMGEVKDGALVQVK
ncbi:ABC transporter substrate-binding protein [Acidimangrovimonas sediminis]|uniref:ABC transporter substrate-binding protein n=1 Tax=Acidimangrovimonas sediminis TaxID=2056283 RepID=UPI000C7FEF6F|nr:ABC transporter substrate-binding protein [Acidimangrovimonas sediminis]